MHSYHIQKSGEASWSSAKTLVISYIGLQTQTVTIKPNLRITMKSDSEVLDEVMVVAYGTAKKSSFTGSASVVSSEEIGKIQTSNVANALGRKSCWCTTK